MNGEANEWKKKKKKKIEKKGMKRKIVENIAGANE